MARLKGNISVAGVSTTTSARTILQLVAPANHRLAVLEVGLGFHGVSATGEPILVELLRQTNAGTMTALSPVKRDASADETLQATAQHTATVEPAAGDVLKRWTIHPQSGLVWQPPAGEEILVGGGGRLGLRVTAAAAVNMDGYMDYEE